MSIEEKGILAELEELDQQQALASDVSSPLARRWYLVVLAFAVGAGCFYAYSKLAMSKTYESTGTVFVDRTSTLGAFGDLQATLGMQTGQAGYVASLLQSNTMMRRVATELELSQNRHFVSEGKNAQEVAERELRRAVTVKTDKNGAVNLAARSNDPDLSAKIINHMLNNLGKLFRTKTQQKISFIEKQIKEAQSKLTAAENQLLSFQQSNKIALIDEETKTFIEQLGNLEGQLVNLDVELQQVRSELADEGDLEELVKLRVRKRSMEASRSVLRSRINQAKEKLAGAPEASLEYARITRNVAMQTKSIQMLTEQHQLASLTRHGEDGEYQVIDWGQPRYEPVGPRAAVNGFLGGVVASTLACLVMLSPRKRPRKETSI